MNLPKLTAMIGEQLYDNSKGEVSSLVADLKSLKKVKNGEESYIVFLVFDLQQQIIYFDVAKKFHHNDRYEYYYFGNNAASSFQYYLTREVDSLHYLLSSTFSDLYNVLRKNGLEDSELGQIIKELGKNDMITISSKKGNGTLNLNKFSVVQNGNIKDIKMRDKKIVINDKECNPDYFIRLFIEDSNKSNKFVMVVPKVTWGNREVILPKHDDYLKVVKIENKLGEFESNNKEGEKRVCYLCKERKTDVSSEYTKNFDRTGINKIFITKKINTSQYSNDYSYDNNYSICNRCYQKLKRGEKVVSDQFSSKIAGENAFIIPEALMEAFDYRYLNYLKKSIDIAFNSDDTRAWVSEVKSEAMEGGINQYSVNFVIYRTDGNSVTVLETIEDVPKLWIDEIIETLEQNRIILNEKEYRVSLGYIYKLIPVKKNKNNEQLDVGRVLSLYKAVLSGEKINHKVLFQYACEALDKGLKQLSKSEIDNYTNMGLFDYINGREDLFIQKLMLSYIILIKTCQQLNLLDRSVFKFIKEEDIMDNFNTSSEKVNKWISELESFLNKQGLCNAERAMFYLGILINRVALAQIEKNHKTKPILKKIQMQGMSLNEVKWLYNDVVEKLIQYDKMTIFTEAVMNRFNYYYSLSNKSWPLDEHENVFYIMAGYSYLVGAKPLDVTKEEEEAQKELLKENNLKGDE